MTGKGWLVLGFFLVLGALGYWEREDIYTWGTEYVQSGEDFLSKIGRHLPWRNTPEKKVVTVKNQTPTTTKPAPPQQQVASQNPPPAPLPPPEQDASITTPPPPSVAKELAKEEKKKQEQEQNEHMAAAVPPPVPPSVPQPAAQPAPPSPAPQSAGISPDDREKLKRQAATIEAAATAQQQATAGTASNATTLPPAPIASDEDNDLPGGPGARIATGPGSVHQILFPTSHAMPERTPWGTMHQNGFTGSLNDACELFEMRHKDFSAEDCDKLSTMLSSCPVMEVENGVVLSDLTFDLHDKKTGKLLYRTSQENVLVNLKNPESRKAYVCNLGNGIFAGRFFTCDNYFRVDTKPKPLRRPKVAVTPPPRNPPEKVASALPTHVEDCCKQAPVQKVVAVCQIDIEIVNPRFPRHAFMLTAYGARNETLDAPMVQIVGDKGRFRLNIPCDLLEKAMKVEVCLGVKPGGPAAFLEAPMLAVARARIARGEREINPDQPIKFDGHGRST